MINNTMLKIFYFFVFLFLYLPSFVIYVIPGKYTQLPISGILSAIFLLFILITKRKVAVKHLKNLYKIKAFKIYLMFLIYIFVTMIFHILMGKYSLSAISNYEIKTANFILLAIPTFLLPTLSPVLGIRFKTIIKVFYIAMYLIFLLGIVQYIAMVFDIQFINYIFDFVTNSRSVALFADCVYNLKRVFCVFSEPSGLCQFIFLTMPFSFNITFSKYKLFNNPWLNIIYKKTIFLLLIINLILSKSPIYLIFSFIEFLVLLIIRYIRYIRKYIILIVLFLVLMLFIIISFWLSNLDKIEETYLYRIYKVVLCLGNYDLLVQMEPSLASRLTSYYIQIKVFLNNIFLGVGFRNIGIAIIPYMLKTKIPLTTEYMQFLNSDAKMWGQNPSIVYTTLAELGIIGFSIYVYFIILMYTLLNKIKSDLTGIQLIFVTSFAQLIVAMTAISFYNYSFECNPFMYFGFIIMIVLYYKLQFYQNKK